MGDCLICDRVTLARAGDNPYFIHEFEHSIFVIGDHQLYRGYALLLLKQHVRDLHDLPAPVQQGLFAELMIATDALVKTFRPDKMNHACLGNEAAHVHWHIFPRYQDDPFWGRQPFQDPRHFQAALIDPMTAWQLAEQVRRQMRLQSIT